MGTNEIDNSAYGDIAGTETAYSIDSLGTDGVTGQETYYTCDFDKWNGIYKKNAIIKSIIDKKSMWTVGKGFKCDKNTKTILGRIKGFGKDTFNSILWNAVTVHEYAGDFYAEIIKDKAGRLTNLKPLNSGRMKNVANEYGVLIGFDYLDSTTKLPIKRFSVDKIFYLAKDRIADEVHGTSTIERMESIILKYSKSIENGQKLQDRNVVPIHIFKLDTDDTTKIAAFKAKADAAVSGGENLFIPMGSVETDVLHLSNIVDPLPWIKALEEVMIISAGVPEEILGGGTNSTDAISRVKYLAYQQMIEWNQLFLEEQIKLQLGLDLEFEFPASIDPAIQETNSKNGNTTNKFGVDPTKQTK